MSEVKLVRPRFSHTEAMRRRPAFGAVCWRYRDIESWIEAGCPAERAARPGGVVSGLT